MKKTIKLSVAAFALAISFMACGGKKSGNGADSVKMDSTVSSAKSSTDSSVKMDTTKPATDTSAAKVDTVKTVKKTSEVKKVKVTKAN